MLYPLLRPLLFRLPAEQAHHISTKALCTALSTRAARRIARSIHDVNDPALAIERFGIRFPNPVGLAAGFDKSGHAFNALGALGFGFIEIGTITAEPQFGNPLPRLFRLPTDQALLNRMGFGNPGAESTAAALRGKPIEPVLGINIGKSKLTPLDNAGGDYLKSLELLEPFARYIAVNVSSPNTPGLRTLQAAGPLRQLLGSLQERAGSIAKSRGDEKSKPILLKIAPDLTDQQLQEVLEVATSQRIAGIIATNTTLSREGLKTPQDKVNSLGEGGISGAPVRARSIEMVSRIYALTAGRLPIVGVGGIFDARDAWNMICAGASLVQIYTGFVYGGPMTACRINKGLLALLRQHGMRSLEQAVGSSHRPSVSIPSGS